MPHSATELRGSIKRKIERKPRRNNRLPATGESFKEKDQKSWKKKVGAPVSDRERCVRRRKGEGLRSRSALEEPPQRMASVTKGKKTSRGISFNEASCG